MNHLLLTAPKSLLKMVFVGWDAMCVEGLTPDDGWLCGAEVLSGGGVLNTQPAFRRTAP